MFTDEELLKIRNYSFEAHCHQVKIYQKQGLEFSGYGILKINQHGNFYLEFICLQKSPLSSSTISINLPNDDIDESQKLYLEATSIKGHIFESNGFKLNLSIFALQKISTHIIFLNQLEIIENINNSIPQFHLEFNQELIIPKNKINTITSTLGSRSSSWNEALIKISDENLEIRIVNENKNKSFIHVTGEIDKDKILDCLKVYLGFCSGLLLQPYYSEYTSQAINIITLYSTNSIYLNHKCFPAILSNYAEKERAQSEYHYDILKCCLKLHSTNINYFNSIYTQWMRVWLSFDSAQDIIDLTLTTAIEGLLNDVFIPIFNQLNSNTSLEQEINEVKKIIKSLEINNFYKERLQNSISYLKNITASKALTILTNNGVINKNEVSSWKKLRNDVAHPKLKTIAMNDISVERGKTISCINLFNSLILQILCYSGPRNYYCHKTKSLDVKKFSSVILTNINIY